MVTTHVLAPLAPARPLVAIIAAVSLWSCSSDHQFDPVCEAQTTLSFEPALAGDGTYEITLDAQGVRAFCSATIIDGFLDNMFGCSDGGGRNGIQGFDVMTGGSTRVETDTSVSQGSPRTVIGVRWRGQSFTANVALKQNGVESPSRRVYFRDTRSEYPADDCNAPFMNATIAAD